MDLVHKQLNSVSYVRTYVYDYVSTGTYVHYVYIYVCAYTYIHIRIHDYVHVCMYICMRTYVQIHSYTGLRTCMNVGAAMLPSINVAIFTRNIHV